MLCRPVEPNRHSGMQRLGNVLAHEGLVLQTVYMASNLLRIAHVASRDLESTPPSHSADQQLALVDHLRRQVVVHVDEEFFVPNQLLAPGGTIYLLHLVELRA